MRIMVSLEPLVYILGVDKRDLSRASFANVMPGCNHRFYFPKLDSDAGLSPQKLSYWAHSRPRMRRSIIWITGRMSVVSGP
jgi:hypothetical protein